MSVVSNLIKVELRIEGIAPGIIFQSKGIMEADEGKSKKPKRTKDEEARLHGHWMKSKGKKVMCIPWIMFHRSFTQAGTTFAYPGNKKKNMSQFIGPTLSCEVDKLSLGTDKFEIYDEYVRIPPKTGAMVRIARPLLREWSVTIPMVVDAEDYEVEILEAVIKYAGRLVGIGANRPGLKGPYGKFSCTSFKVR